LYFFSRHSLYTNHLPAAGLAGRYGNGGTRQAQKICQKFDTGVVGPAFYGWAVRDNLMASPSSPVIAFFRARG
jgi:hypothetical protein